MLERATSELVPPDATLVPALRRSNEALWELEDLIRDPSHPDPAQVARGIAAWNDRRCAIKRAIDVSLHAACPETKVYDAVPVGAPGAG